MEEIKLGNNSFFIGEDEKSPSGMIEYRPDTDGVWLVTSTRVEPSLRNQGMAKKLLDELANHARKKGYKLRAQCSYVVKKFEEDRSYDDVKV